MPKLLKINHIFVEDIPKDIETGILYISINDSIAKHKCCCGCGYSVVTPFSPTDWQITFDGKTVTLYPSIGNWDYSCRSHYFIRKNKVVWAGKMSTGQIQWGRDLDKVAKEEFYKEEE